VIVQFELCASVIDSDGRASIVRMNREIPIPGGLTEGQIAVYLRAIPYEFAADVAHRVHRTAAGPEASAELVPGGAAPVPRTAP